MQLHPALDLLRHGEGPQNMAARAPSAPLAQGQGLEEDGGPPYQQHVQPARGQEGGGATSSRPRISSARSLFSEEGGGPLSGSMHT